MGILLAGVDVFSWTVVVVGYSVVFAALVVMFFIVTALPKILNIQTRKRLKKEGKEECQVCEDMTGEVNAAISMALHMYFDEMHDEESGMMTIKRVSRSYSPWSSKLYGLNTYYQQKR
jgi:Na+-transporting methylmalonyl-CoA/oxaloacetate decarboxylase gamma subunit